MEDRRWVLSAACRNKPVRLFDADNTDPRDRNEAARTCNGCPVLRECRADTLLPMNVSQLIRQLCKVELDEPDDLVPVNGVFRAGVAVVY